MENPHLKKLNFRNQKTIFILNSPVDPQVMFGPVPKGTDLKLHISASEQAEFAIGFALNQKEVNELAETICPRLKDDAILWMCYPKGTSKKYKCDFNRDTGREIMGNYDMEEIRQVSIDEDWSAIRFRKTDYIKKLTRKFSALSEKGRKKARQSE